MDFPRHIWIMEIQFNCNAIEAIVQQEYLVIITPALPFLNNHDADGIE